ncbi:MAG: hypothetical protein JOY76_07645 [Hyphomicrobiales bacterium]|nr:hypothetical protein [Hyphomicrobiales bacterium]
MTMSIRPDILMRAKFGPAKRPSPFARRLIGFAALGLANVLAVPMAEARVPAHRPVARAVPAISVDVGPLLAQGLGGYAEALRAELSQALQAQFAGSLRPGERLVVVIRSISLAAYSGDINVFGLPDNDYLDGVVTLIGPNGQEVATKDILATSLSSSGGPWYQAGGEQRRGSILAQSFAAWARRYIPT